MTRLRIKVRHRFFPDYQQKVKGWINMTADERIKG